MTLPTFPTFSSFGQLAASTSITYTQNRRESAAPIKNVSFRDIPDAPRLTAEQTKEAQQLESVMRYHEPLLIEQMYEYRAEIDRVLNNIDQARDSYEQELKEKEKLMREIREFKLKTCNDYTVAKQKLERLYGKQVNGDPLLIDFISDLNAPLRKTTDDEDDTPIMR